MKFSAILAAVAAATVVNAQGYNSTSEAVPSTQMMASATVYDSRTVNVPPPSASPTTAVTSIYTITTTCGSVTVFKKSTTVYPLSTRSGATYTGTSTGGAAIKTQVAALAGAGGLMAAALLL